MLGKFSNQMNIGLTDKNSDLEKQTFVVPICMIHKDFLYRKVEVLVALVNQIPKIIFLLFKS